MNKLILMGLSIRNFKGVRSFSIKMDGENVQVFGDNATGKTTIFDAFNWILFDKDSQNKKDFSIKTLDAEGKEFHGLEHEVEVDFLYNTTPITLRKVFMEKWTKKRGSTTDEFTGHETKYFIDGVPSKKKEFTDKVAQMVDETIFKLLTSPSYFNEQLHWQDRRKTLLDICGDVTAQEVINFNLALEPLEEILKGRKIEDHRKVIASRRSEINKELEKIPVRIDELKRNMPQAGALEKAKLEKELSQLNVDIDEKMALINNIRNGNAISEKQRAIQEIEIELLKIRQEHQLSSGDKVYQLKAKIQEEKSNGGLLLSKIDRFMATKNQHQANIKEYEEHVQHYRAIWQEINDEQFIHESECNCPTCGQELPEDQIQTTKEKALTQFNYDKSSRLENIISKGKSFNEKITGLKNQIEGIDKDIPKVEEQLKVKKEIISKLEKELSTYEETIVDIMEIPEYKAKFDEKEIQVKTIREYREGAEKASQSIQEEIEGLKEKRNDLQNEIGVFGLIKDMTKRIVALMDQERDLAREFEKLESELYLTEEFIRSKVSLLEQKINSKFKYARFKMFSEQINGGLAEVCETVFNGVPYSSGLNNASKINVGLDIINTLSEHYGFCAPIFIDNAEAVTRFIETKAQTISLVVSEADKELRIKTENKNMEVMN